MAALQESFATRASKYWSSATADGTQPPNANHMASAFLELMDRKKTNLCVAADMIHKDEILKLADAVGPYICLFKTHVDVLVDFDETFPRDLLAIAKKHDFLIFEDRKFADIGNTVKHQYAYGMYSIARWSHITNAHSIPGDGIVQGLKNVGLDLDASGSDGIYLEHPRALLLLAEMSSTGSLAEGSYTEKTLEMARRHRDFVIGFVASRRLSSIENEDFITFTPGVQLSSGKDTLGQQYRTPEIVIMQGSDCIIVGRGIYEAGDPVSAAKLYRDAGWSAYLKRIAK